MVLLAVVVVAVGCSKSKTPAAASTTSSSSSSLAAGQPDRLHPSPTLTPGDVFPVTAEQVCVRGYSASVRSVSESTRDQVFAEYGLTNVNREDYEVDHLISLELGGSNDIKNLWPEPLHDPAGNGAVDKDAIENQLHDMVCSGETTLADAQHAIVHWDTVNIASLVSTTTTTAPTTAAPTTAPPPPPTTAPSGGDVYYANCAAARAAGAAPLYRGQPGYRPALDRDGDGVACE